jgi:RNA polymerase sigma-70 factor, ECF subfamily
LTGSLQTRTHVRVTVPLSQRSDRQVAPDTGDQAIVARVRGGEYEAFGILFRTYYGSLFQFARRITGSADVAEDVVQDVFVAVWERRETWEVASSVTAYLHGAVRNRALRYARRVATTARLAPFVESEASGNDIESAVAAADVDAEVARAITRLPSRCRTVYTLRWHHQLTYSEIAHILGLSVKTVEAHVAHALRVLRTKLRRFV